MITEECLHCLKKAQEMEAELGQIVEKKNKTHKLNLKVSRALWSGNHPEQAAISHLQQINPSLAGPGRGGLKSDVCARHLANRPEVFKSFLEDVAQGFSFEAELDKLDLKLIDPMHPTPPTWTSSSASTRSHSSSLAMEGTDEFLDCSTIINPFSNGSRTSQVLA